LVKLLLCMLWISWAKLADLPFRAARPNFIQVLPVGRPGSLKYMSVPVRIILISVFPPSAAMCMSWLIRLGVRWYCRVPVSLDAWEPVTWMCSVVTAELMVCAWVAAVSRALPAEPLAAEPVAAEPVPDDAAAPVVLVAPVLAAEPLPPEEHAASRARAAADRPMATGRREEPGIGVTQKRYKVCAGLAGEVNEASKRGDHDDGRELPLWP
jgi:hypothetical protein